MIIPRASSRTNIAPTSDECEFPRSVLIGAYTRRGVGVTNASTRDDFKGILKTVHSLAKTRKSQDPYCSVQLNHYSSLAVHRDQYNHDATWLIAVGNFRGGRLWTENPSGQGVPPPCCDASTQHLRGTYHCVRNKW
eukprot:6441335-Amphidinium_carterae.1